MNLSTFQKLMSDLPSTPRMPVLFVGHGSPQNALEDNPFTRAWKTVGQNLPRPNAILCVSAHWFVDLPAGRQDEEVSFFAEGISHSSISMRSFIIK